MKRALAIFLIVVLVLSVSGWSLAASEAGFELSWSSLDGGGGVSRGGGLTLSGTLGQPDAGALSGGGYQLAGGFWQAPVPAPGVEYRLYLPQLVH
jgi:hypothetical protein